LPYGNLQIGAESNRTIIRAVNIDSAPPPGAPTNTPTNTSTATPTETNTPTATFTPSLTPTFTLTPIFSYTPSNTPTITNTPTNTPTFTPTFTPTITPTSTPVCVVTPGSFSKSSNGKTYLFLFNAVNIPQNETISHLLLRYSSSSYLEKVVFSNITTDLFWPGPDVAGSGQSQDVTIQRMSSINNTLIKASNSIELSFSNNKNDLSQMTVVFQVGCPSVTVTYSP
jgi:hypothetical protein